MRATDAMTSPAITVTPETHCKDAAALLVQHRISALPVVDSNGRLVGLGGGVDIPVSTHFAIRPAEVNYVLTRFGNNFTFGNNNQSNFRYQGGIEFRF